jgi:tRNA modification GTPase
MTSSTKNIASLLTPPGAAAIAVVRVVGPRAAEFLRSHFSKAVTAGRCVHGILRDGETELDDPVVVMSRDDGTSYDLNLHGGAWVVRSVLELARREGFEIHSGDVVDDAVDSDD